MKKRNFINLSDINKNDLSKILDRANKLKSLRNKNKFIKKTLDRTNLAMIFEKPSTRTRVSFELAIKELGGNAIILDENTTHLARGETIADTARVLERYCHIFMVRTNKHSKLLDYDKYSKVPIVNGLSNISHPCQILADIMTFEEKKGSIKNKTITWLGDLNNVLYSWVEAAKIFQFYLNISHPNKVKNNKAIKEIASKNTKFFSKPLDAAENSDCLITDTWFSMGSKKNKGLEKKFLPYQVNKNIFKVAKKKAVFMHCLPAERTKEVSADIIDNVNISLVWDEAENRLHVQKAILEWCLNKI